MELEKVKDETVNMKHRVLDYSFRSGYETTGLQVDTSMSEIRKLLTEARLEYFCNACGQLRLWACDGMPSKCGNCGSQHILIGGINALDSLSLKAEFEKNQSNRK
jgi:hypothetical protein